MEETIESKAATMVSSDQKQLVVDLARDIVAEIAPQELPLFRTMSTAYFNNPEKVLKIQSGKDEMLGFGLGEAVVMLTPSILVTMSQVVQFVTAEVQKSVASNSAGVINDIVSKMFKKFRSADKKDQEKIPALTTEQLAQIRNQVYEKARKLLPDDQAALVADSSVGSLVIASS